MDLDGFGLQRILMLGSELLPVAIGQHEGCIEEPISLVSANNPMQGLWGSKINHEISHDFNQQNDGKGDKETSQSPIN